MPKPPASAPLGLLATLTCVAGMNVQDSDDLNAATERLHRLAQRRRDDRPQPPDVVSGSRVRALAGVGAALALCSPPGTFRSLVEHAMAAGATAEEVLGTLLAVAPTIGAARVVANTPGLALALGYDIDAAMEEMEDAAGA